MSDDAKSDELVQIEDYDLQRFTERYELAMSLSYVTNHRAGTVMVVMAAIWLVGMNALAGWHLHGSAHWFFWNPTVQPASEFHVTIHQLPFLALAAFGWWVTYFTFVWWDCPTEDEVVAMYHAAKALDETYSDE